jgi:SAM-dependent methyltransferase
MEEFDHVRMINRKLFNPFLPEDKSSSILDVACGAGHFLYYLQKEGYINTRGIDLSEEQLTVASKMGVKNLEMANLFDYLPKVPTSFEMIVGSDIIEHLKKEEVLHFLDLIYRALKNNGTALILTPNAGSLFGANMAYIDFTHETSFTPVSLAQVLRICNYEDVKVYGDAPVAYDWRSGLRSILWCMARNLLRLYLTIERGTGRGLWKESLIFEPRMFAVAMKRPDGEKNC